jgi:hypothetical protein
VPQVIIARNPSYRKNCLRLRGLEKTLCCIKIRLESAGSPGVYPSLGMHMILPHAQSILHLTNYSSSLLYTFDSPAFSQ